MGQQHHGRVDHVCSPATAERLYRHTGGHPLHTRTLLSEFTPAQLASSEGNLPVPRSLASATVARLAELPDGARSLAAALAVLNHGAPLQVVAPVGGVTEPSLALDGLVSTGFVTWQPGNGQGQLDFYAPHLPGCGLPRPGPQPAPGIAPRSRDGDGGQCPGALTATGELGTPQAMGTATLAKAALARVRNEPAKVVEALQLQADSEDYGSSKISSLVWTPAYIAALLDLGRIEAARGQLSRFRQAAAERGLSLPSRIMALQAYLSASEARPDQAVAESRQSIELITADVPWNFARAPVPIALWTSGFSGLLSSFPDNSASE
jgi:hypothetical protein